MGAYLSQPVTEKVTDKGENDAFSYGVSTMQGWRTSMEDAHVIKLNLDSKDTAAFFGVYDGHGGAEVARYCSVHMPDEFVKCSSFQKGDILGALKQTYLGIDDLLRDRGSIPELKTLKEMKDDTNLSGSGLPLSIQQAIQGHRMQQDDNGEAYSGPSAGCTAVVAVVLNKRLYVANAGDSRCVLCRGKETVSLTHDHKPTDPGEESRIRAAGGYIAEGRINGSLNLSRAIGDMDYKQSKDKPAEEQVVTADPDCKDIELTKDDRFLILACDGIWDILTNEEAVAFVDEKLSQGHPPDKVCEMLCDRCLATSTDGMGKGCDNMSVLIVLLKDVGL